MHGVGSRKIKRMLDMYEHNITAEMLFAMLPPLLVSSRQSAPVTAAAAANELAYNHLSDTSDASNLCTAGSLASSPSSSMGTCVTYVKNSAAQSILSVLAVPSSVASTVTSSGTASASPSVSAISASTTSSESAFPASVASHCCISSADLVCGRSGISSSTCLVSEAVSSGDVAVASAEAACRDTAKMKHGNCETAGMECNTISCARTGCTERVFSVPAATLPCNNPQFSAITSSQLVSSCDTSVTVGPLPTTDIACASKWQLTEGATTSIMQLDLQPENATNLPIEVSKTCRQQSQAKLIEVNSDSENGGILSESVGGLISSASETGTCSCTDLVLRSLSSGVPLHSNQLPIDNVQPPADTLNISLVPAFGTDTQESDVTTQIPSETFSPAGLGRRVLSTESRAELADSSGCNLSLCDVNLACSQHETVDGKQKYLELEHCLMDSNAGCLSFSNQSPVLPSVEPNDTTLHVDDRFETRDLKPSGRATAEMCSISTDERLSFEVTADNVESTGVVESDAQIQKGGSFPVTENNVQTSTTQFDSERKAVELMYWGRTNVSDTLPSGDEQGNLGLCDMDESIPPARDAAVEQLSPVVGPKPQRTRLHGCQKKNVSSFSESILAGREWISEEQGLSFATQPSEDSSPGGELLCRNADQSNTKCCVSDDRQTSSTQTESRDFFVLTKVSHNDELIKATVADLVAVIETIPRDISEHLSDDHMPASVSSRPVFHKSCSTADDHVECVESSSQVEFLVSCFPSISCQDLRELLAKCGNDVIVAVDLLLEFGYEYNEPHGAHSSSSSCIDSEYRKLQTRDVTEIRSSSTSSTDSAGCSLDHSVVAENGSNSGTKATKSKRNTSTLYKLCRDSLISKGIRLTSRLVQPRHDTMQVLANLPPSSWYLVCFMLSSVVVISCSVLILRSC